MNPYFNRGAISDPKYFFGRREILSHIYTALNAPKPQNISIEGERRIGKSSLLNYLMHPQVKKEILIRPDNFVLVLTDFLDYQPQDAADFLRTLHYYLCLELEQTWQGENISREARSKRERVESVSSKQIRQLKRGLKDHLMDLKNAGYHVVFLVDEADSVFLRARLDYSIFDLMRSLADVSRFYSVSYVIASRRPLRAISKALDASKFHNIFYVERLGLLTHKEALELIQKPSQEAGIRFSPKEEEFIFDLAGYHPLALQIACYYLFEQKSIGPVVDFGALREVIYAQMRPIMEDWWEDSSAEERQVLKAAAEMLISVDDSQMVEPMKKLLERGLVVEQQGGVKCFCKLFREFVLEQPIEGVTQGTQEGDADLSSRVNYWIKQGESQTIEFKRELPENMTQLAKEIAAFSSANGGVILVGVEDDGRICGIPVRSPSERDRFRQRIYGVAAKAVKPPVSAEIDFIEIQGKVLAIIQIPPGREPLYYVEGRPYVRYGCIVTIPGPGEIAYLYSRVRGDALSLPIPASPVVQQEGLREEVWKLIGTVELGLRQFIAKVLQKKVGQDWEQFLAKRHPKLYENWIIVQERHQKSLKRYDSASEQKETVLDYSFIADLESLINADWEFYRYALNFDRGSSKENKRYWCELIKTIAKVRNALAHHRFVPENEMERAKVFCNDILIVLGVSLDSTTGEEISVKSASSQSE